MAAYLKRLYCTKIPLDATAPVLDFIACHFSGVFEFTKRGFCAQTLDLDSSIYGNLVQWWRQHSPGSSHHLALEFAPELVVIALGKCDVLGVSFIEHWLLSFRWCGNCISEVIFGFHGGMLCDF